MSVAMIEHPRRNLAPKPDGRTVAARLMRDTVAALTQQIGGSPTLAQQMLIRTAAMLRVRLAEMDHAFQAGEPADHAAFAATSGSLTAILRELGVA